MGVPQIAPVSRTWSLHRAQAERKSNYKGKQRK